MKICQLRVLYNVFERAGFDLNILTEYRLILGRGNQISTDYYNLPIALVSIRQHHKSCINISPKVYILQQ